MLLLLNAKMYFANEAASVLQYTEKRVKAIKIKQFSAPSLAAVEGRGSNKGVRNTLHHSHD